ncbi:TadE/TadG family type IV pilus assembly protein [Noviherbaspirillum sp. CPCC 100848]|uniref:TadE/TadG family type IV pilus assembly protein n=1 Tax=Noviherbaspirillum album TaxID=3080276 RepID=A0ABU6JJH8_9BURK|nr:TadE/TadG family type IV pilus assembly protein [Noviherbaspirillum sp. CPCC 100848]MEC4723327.1 TadE/TadG family type IV pilus assembly protein [Noviherbaspirillum sp. CPCC 100848]
MTHHHRGAALVELALILPLLLLLTFITTEFGRAVYQYNTIAKSMRDAVRYLSVQTPGTRMTEARNLVVFGNTAGTGTPLALGLNLTHVANPTWQVVGSNPVINTVSITVQGYTFRPLFASVIGVNFGNFNFSDISATMRAPGP